MTGVYVHVPFCRRRCLYCDFYSVGERLAEWPDYVGALLSEASARIPELRLSADRDETTLYIGGGTPSLIPADCFARLASGLLEQTGHCSGFTIEANPDDVSDEKARLWRECGVSRISMGVQSLVDSELRAIGRRHDSATARRAYETLRRYFDNISLDLMFGLPGQTVDSLMDSVGGVIAMNPDHVSAYSLMYEERTALTRLRDTGRLEEMSDDDCNCMFASLSDALADAGYEQYEISNYARPGYRSRHNSLYWQGVPYVGLGPGAHSYDGNRLRTANRPDVRAYMAYWLGRKGDSPADTEELGVEELREEMIMTRLRTREGLSLSEYSAAFGQEALESLVKYARKWIDAGNMEISPDRSSISLSRTGIMISDEIMASLF